VDRSLVVTNEVSLSRDSNPGSHHRDEISGRYQGVPAVRVPGSESTSPHPTPRENFPRLADLFKQPARAAGNPVLGLNRITSTSRLGAMFQLQGTRLLSGRRTALKLDSILSRQFD